MARDLPALAVSEAVALQAAEWFFLLQSGEASAADRERWAGWRAADPAHEAAWQRAQRVSRVMGQVPADLALPVLDRPAAARRRAAVKALALLLTAAPATWLAWCHSPARHWAADHRTATGERREVQLADGTRLLLDTASAVDIAFDGDIRRVRLRQGAIAIRTASDPQPGHRPFVVDTNQGRLRALGTHFTVRQFEARTQVAVLEGAVEVQARSGARAVARAGWQTAFSATGVDALRPTEAQVDAWTRGILHARDMRLQDFAAELGRYRPGVLRCDPAVAELRISGVFQLADTTPVLDSLPRALPVEVIYRTPYWVTLAAPGS